MTTDVVRLEVLAGETDIRRLTAALDGCEDVVQLHRNDAESAAAIYRPCRRAGETIRSLNDCLVAAIALRNHIPVLHNDEDFDVIARHTELEAVRA
jgi:predicted nucleic acid-binding protein